jgi:hypothetical protein
LLRVTDDVLELRQWAEERRGRPCRRPDGRIGLCFGHGLDVVLIGWEEFEPNFCVGRCVFVYDDAPKCTRWFIGTPEEARAYVSAADPWLTGATGPTP